ncbi:MAG: GDP-L-fucose synthase [Deltaproteobacteria bacterium]|nr:GDP-L-fucose synthase [Deltaproteobacteria bacterium]MBW2017791.1 GDP-L-fucose synthase [Deltaproteobacteria bacterium]MBW2130375.1 GDP-L-fucose synthase [Deltaproteobacteria bacterium]MBW2304262.1 GDP-L-fucose synthase [Deltaproteobacteria bacterium]
MDREAKIYIAGHRGLVGSAIRRKLESRGYGNLVLRTHEELDLTRQEAVEAFFEQERPEYVFLAAARVGGILANNTYPADFIYHNLAIQTNVIHAAHLFGVKKLLFLGSSCIYPKHCPQPMKEDFLLSGPLEPTNEPYAVAKIAGIKMCQSYNRQHGSRFISVMPTNLYGPNDNFDLESSHVLPALLRKFHLAKLAAQGDREGIRRDEARYGSIPGDIKQALGLNGTTSTPQPLVTLWGTGTPRREFLHVDDLADACLYLMDTYEGKDIVNIGMGEDLSIEELAVKIARIVGYRGEWRFDPSRPDGTPRKLLDVSRLYHLGWRPRIGLDQGIAETYRWYQENLTCTSPDPLK